MYAHPLQPGELYATVLLRKERHSRDIPPGTPGLRVCGECPHCYEEFDFDPGGVPTVFADLAGPCPHCGKTIRLLPDYVCPEFFPRYAFIERGMAALRGEEKDALISSLEGAYSKPVHNDLAMHVDQIRSGKDYKANPHPSSAFWAHNRTGSVSAHP